MIGAEAGAEEPTPPPSAPGVRSREIPNDFRTLDFRRLWQGRSRTSEVESEFASRGLQRLPVDRVVEIGTGDGRLTPVVRAVARSYIGVDQNLRFLEQLRSELPRGPTTLLVEANAYHLPFVDGVASSILLARVYNFLVDPEAALVEFGRVLAPGGGVVLTCHVRPSVSSLVDDIRAGVRRPAGGPVRASTFDRSPVVAARPSEFPAWSPRRRHLRRTLEAAGFSLLARYGSGLEDFRVVRALPASVFLRAGSSFAEAPVFPLAWEVARRGPPPAGLDLPPLAASIACPRCRKGFGELPLQAEFSIDCPGCGFTVRNLDGILRARYAAS